MSRVLRFVKDWMLPIGMALGASLYLVYWASPWLHPVGSIVLKAVKTIQPVLLFAMLFLTFCKVEPHDLRPHRWHGWLLLVQISLFALSALAVIAVPSESAKAVIESFMLCMICPTATACAVVTGKLGGDMAGVISYTILINLVTAVMVPLIVPAIHPVEGVTFVTSFSLIMAKVFPLLVCPCLLAWLVRYLLPPLHKWLLSFPNLPFYIWAVSLTLAILMTTRALMHSSCGLLTLSGIGIVSLLSCVLQFWGGKCIGQRYGHRITAGQALGQKNTVFAIWMGYTFMSPVTSVAGGFYSIWHNVFNSWQLYRQRKAIEAGVTTPVEK